MRFIFATIAFLLTTTSLFGQNLPFSHTAYSNIGEMNKTIPDLAEKVIPLFEKDRSGDKVIYFASLSRFQMIAKQYREALISIDSAKAYLNSDDDNIATYAYPFWLYAATRLKMSSQDTSFDKIFDEEFSRSYEQFSYKAVDMAENYFKADLQTRQQRYLEMVARLRKNNRDSISYSDAKSLCFFYLNYLVYTAELPGIPRLLETLNDKKFIIEDSIMITMRDGARLSATTVRMRNATGPLPVILKFGIYPAASEVPEARYIAAHGYAAVIADTRGKRLSSEPVEPFVHDATDAYDIIDWISKQPWCNGKVGMFGGSYLGFSQWAALKKIHPALKTIVPQAAVGIGVDIPFMFGIYWADMLDWLHLVTNNRLTDWSGSGNKASWDSVRLAWYKSGKAFNSLDTMEGRPNRIFQNYLHHPYLDPFWGNLVPYKQEFAAINIPILTITGYYDDDQRGAMYYFDQHHLYNSKAEHYLLIGPYDHGGSQGYPFDPPAVVNGYPIDKAAQIKIIDVVFEWFGYILKGGPKPDMLSDRINFEVMGANKWRHVSSLKNMYNDSITFYLSSQLSGKNYKMSDKPVVNNKPIIQTIDLTDRSNSQESEPVLNGDGPVIDTTLVKDNCICFASDPLSQAIDLNGSFVCNLKMIINKKDADLAIRLYEQLPDGKFFQISNNIARCSYLKKPGTRLLITPGKSENIFFDNSFLTSRHLSAGSRIVLLIGINKNSSWEINYGSGKEVSIETIKDAGTPMKIQWQPNGSFIKLPVWK